MAVSGQLGLFNMPEAPRGPMSYPTKSAGPAADILQAVVEALTGAAGLPTGMDSKATRVGEMLGAVLPMGATGSLAGLARQLVKGAPTGTLAGTLRRGSAVGQYDLRDQAIERVRALYQHGNSLPTTSNWAGSQSDELLRAFGGDQESALRWSRMWGATSPNTSVPTNTRESVSALAHALENPHMPFTVEMAQNLPDAKITMAPSKVPNLNRALDGTPLSGDKVEAMAGFMAGKPRIPLDVHALYAVGSKSDKLSPELPGLRAMMTKSEKLPARGSLTDTDLYLRYEDALRRGLQDIAPGRSINQVFAELWEGARSHKGLKPQGGPIDILRKKGLLEIGAMLDPERLRSALRQAGWTAPAIAGLLSALGESGEGIR
jgi:hypothetical protein